jgi:hypothetical protein
MKSEKLPGGTKPSREWQVTGVSRAAPRAAPEEPAGPGGAGQAGAGEAAWRRRLAPRHREVVRRFFSDEAGRKR